MRKFFPVEELARDSRFTQINMRQAEADPRTAFANPDTAKRPKISRLTPSRPDASEAARNLMHGIFAGAIQALEGAGRTCHDFELPEPKNSAAPDTALSGVGPPEALPTNDAHPTGLRPSDQPRARAPNTLPRQRPIHHPPPYRTLP